MKLPYLILITLAAGLLGIFFAQSFTEETPQFGGDTKRAENNQKLVLNHGDVVQWMLDQGMNPNNHNFIGLMLEEENIPTITLGGTSTPEVYAETYVPFLDENDVKTGASGVDVNSIILEKARSEIAKEKTKDGFVND